MVRKLGLFSALFLIFSISLFGQNRIVGVSGEGAGPFVIKGKIQDKDTREPIIGANFILEITGTGESANLDGEFEITLPRGIYLFRVSSIGYNDEMIMLEVRGSGGLNIRLEQSINQLDEIVVIGVDPDANVRQAAAGVEKLSIESISSLPPFAGEVDVLKSLTLLPGVSSAGEAASGFNVRGGGYDQNLILLGGAPIYNPSHLFGFFSAFNADMINDLILYKGGIPANYGGRASSILDLSLKKGDMQNWGGNVQLGNISTKLSIGGPVIKNKLSIIGTGRVSYANYLINLVPNSDIKNSAAQFYDGSLVANYQISENSNLEYSTYYSSDGFKLASDTTFAWRNYANVLTFNHAFSEQFFLKASVNNSRYGFDIIDQGTLTGFKLSSKINDLGGNLEFKYVPSERQRVTFGAQSKYLIIEPGALLPQGNESVINSFIVPSEQALETGFFAQHEIEIANWLGISYGLRYVDYRYLGPKTTFNYDDRFPQSEETIVDENNYNQNEVIQTYNGFEPRLSLRLSLSNNTSIKMGYNRMNQFIHLLSNTATIAPTDIWKLSDQFIRPQSASQYSIGLFQNFMNNAIETSIEGYYKSLTDVLEYKDGADLILNPYIESDLLTGIGEAYGLEFYAKKKKGRMTGWMSYTYSRSIRQVIGSYPEETINGGRPYPSNFDKPHDFTAVMEYRFSNFLKFSSIFNYSTGRPVTYPTAKFLHLDQDIAFYDTRNQNRILDYHRLDMSLTFSFNTDRKLLDGEWVLSVYNVYARRNAFSIFFDDLPNNPPQAYKLTIMGIALPSLSYNVKF